MKQFLVNGTVSFLNQKLILELKLCHVKKRIVKFHSFLYFITTSITIYQVPASADTLVKVRLSERPFL